MSATTAKCPVCGHPEIRRHCGETAKTCTWEKCRRQACSAVFDPTRGRGYVMEGSSSRVFTFGASA